MRYPYLWKLPNEVESNVSTDDVGDGAEARKPPSYPFWV